MFDTIESKITFEIPTNLDMDILTNNYTLLFSEMDTLSTLADKKASGGVGSVMGDDEYNRFIGDVWVGIILTLMIISSIFCMCACFLYHKFRQWKRSVNPRQSSDLLEAGTYPLDGDILPSYTIVSGLPTYDDALEQLRKLPQHPQRPSLMKLFSFEGVEKFNNLQDKQLVKDIPSSPKIHIEEVHKKKTFIVTLPSYEEALLSEQSGLLPEIMEILNKRNICIACGSNSDRPPRTLMSSISVVDEIHQSRCPLIATSSSLSSLDDFYKNKNQQNDKSLSLNFCVNENLIEQQS